MKKEEYQPEKKETEVKKMTTYVVKREFKNTVNTDHALERLVQSHIK